MFVKLRLLLWKNLIIRRRHWFLTICEILVPVFLFVLVAYARAQMSQMGKQQITTPTYGEIYNAEAIYSDGYNKKLLYTPKTTFTEDLMEKVRIKLSTADEDTIGFTTESQLLQYVKKNENSDVMAVVFNGDVENVPEKLSYDIRIYQPYIDWKIDKRFVKTHAYVPDQGSINYKRSGFTAFQLAIDTSFIETTANRRSVPVTLTFQEFPFPPYTVDIGLEILYEIIFPIVTLFSFMCLLVTVIKRVVEEKASGSKELMKMAGLRSWMLWSSWFIHAFSVNLIAVGIIVALMKGRFFGANYPPIEFCSVSVLFVFLTLYVIASITFCFLISAIFKRPTLASNFGATIWFLGNSLASAVIQKYDHVYFLKYLFCLFPNTAMNFGYLVISKYEIRETSLTWENFSQRLSEEAIDFSMLSILMFLLIDAVIYMLLALYVDAINPGDYGLAKPWHFPILGIYNKFKECKKSRRNSIQVGVEIEDNGGKVIEKTPQNLQVGIKVENLTKKYGRNTAVDKLSMKVLKDQITVLLGHNGAGKSTTMSVITGMLRATSGKILINGHNIEENTSNIQSSFGLCPQHNLLFTDLTVMEHLVFFGVLRGLSFEAARAEAGKLLIKMTMYDKKDSLARQLSGGMQRKLCLAMALIGDSKVLILDEPTSGMDPESRRFIWDVLLSCRGSRTILITTHFMEEADVLGDWIAIMDHGSLICYGTPLFLKQQIGTGYNLSVVRDSTAYKHNEVDQIIKQYVPAAYQKGENGDTLMYLLPDESKLNFPELLKQLENNKDELGILSISVSVTTLEDVFLKVGRTAKRIEKDVKTLETRISLTESTTSIESTTSSFLDSQKMMGLLRKRWYVFLKKLKIQGVQWFIAFSIILLAVILSHASSTRNADGGKTERLPLDLSVYENTEVFYGSDVVKLQDAYGNIVRDRGSVPVKSVKDVNSAILDSSLKDFMHYKNRLIVAAEFNRTEREPLVNVMYSNLALHGLPISLNLIMNTILKTSTNDGFSIESGNSPLSGVASSTIPRTWDVEVGLAWLMIVPVALFFLVGGFIIFPQQERASNIVQLQYMCGIRAYIYWLSTYLFDLAIYTIITIFILFTIFFYEAAIATHQIFSGLNETTAMFTIMLVFALPGILYCYLFSYKSSSAGAFTAFLMVSLFTGIMVTLVVQALILSGDVYYTNVGESLRAILTLLPSFGVSYTVLNFARKAAKNYHFDVMSSNQRNITCRFDYNPCCDGDTTACKQYKSYFFGNDLAVGNDLIIMVFSSFLYLVLLLLLESIFLQRFWEKMNTMYYRLRMRKNYYSFDEQIDSNPENGLFTKPEDTLMEAKHLQKIYGCNKAVRNVSFTVKPGECFCLLGVNGAGKSTTFRMLTGREAATKGTVNVRTENGQVLTLDKNASEYLRHMGYCPQTNAINQDLTGRQMLETFAAFRGIAKEKIDDEVNKLLELLELKEFADKPCGDYSGGNKRKLCFALAFIGTPPLILLDEPTSGVDAAARRKMWELMMNVKNNSGKKTSIVLTSHSMDECEALSNTLAIMKNGSIYCQGTVPRLKQQYGKGFTVMLKLKSTVEPPIDEVDGVAYTTDDLDSETENLLQIDEYDSKQVKDVMRSVYKLYRKNIELKDKHLGLLHYHISDPNKKWNEIFKEIEDLKHKHSVIEDYSISETSLEDVFLSVASADNDESDGRKSANVDKYGGKKNHKQSSRNR